MNGRPAGCIGGMVERTKSSRCAGPCSGRRLEGRRATRSSYGAMANDVSRSIGLVRLGPSGNRHDRDGRSYKHSRGLRIFTRWFGGDAGQLRRAKVGVTAAFIAHAVVFSSWAAHIPHVKAELGLSDAALGTALFGAPAGSLVAAGLCHWALPRWGSRRMVPI